jgi:cell division protein FtsB
VSPTAAATRTSRGNTAPARPRHQPGPAPVRRHLRPVPDTKVQPERPSARRRLRPQAALMLALGAFFVILFGVALLQTVLVQGQIHLDGLRADVAETQVEARILQAEVATLESPAHILEQAEAMGMIPPEDITYLTPPAGDAPPTP